MGFEFLFHVLLLITCGEIIRPINGVDELVLTDVTLSVKLGERYIGTVVQGFGRVG
jgi:hypothetical protein